MTFKVIEVDPINFFLAPHLVPNRFDIAPIEVDLSFSLLLGHLGGYEQLNSFMNLLSYFNQLVSLLFGLLLESEFSIETLAGNEILQDFQVTWIGKRSSDILVLGTVSHDGIFFFKV